MSGPVTLGDLDRSGKLILVWCHCGHRAELASRDIHLPRKTPVPGLTDCLRCTSCGARNTPIDHPVSAVVDPRPEGVTGHYPAHPVKPA